MRIETETKVSDKYISWLQRHQNEIRDRMVDTWVRLAELSIGNEGLDIRNRMVSEMGICSCNHHLAKIACEVGLEVVPIDLGIVLIEHTIAGLITTRTVWKHSYLYNAIDRCVVDVTASQFMLMIELTKPGERIVEMSDKLPSNVFLVDGGVAVVMGEREGLKKELGIEYTRNDWEIL